MRDVPKDIFEEFRESEIYPSAENKAKREEERAIRDRIAHEKEEYEKKKADNLSIPITAVTVDELIDFILSAWGGGSMMEAPMASNFMRMECACQLSGRTTVRASAIKT
ncbi:hypothetical protein [Porphyromonas gingivalis]|uniref:hypothetical protein n=1 Tax=Porphyromonas gingivalis TaxID=837 RepID=UPI0015CF6540|nr:hypothetical protein [Porphyromonas gingivalis]